MYAVIGAILVLLILLLLLVARRKKKDASSARAKSQPAAKAAPRQRPTRADKAARYAQLRQEAASTPMALAGLEDPGAASGADQAFALPQAPLPPVGYSPPAMPPMLPIAPAPRVQSVPMEEILPGTDPLQAVIAEVLNGWGDLTQEDTNRLGVFRPDRVMAAVASTDIPRELKSSEHARARLGQLRRWAAGLEYGSARREQAYRSPRVRGRQHRATDRACACGRALACGARIPGPSAACSGADPAPTSGGGAGDRSGSRSSGGSSRSRRGRSGGCSSASTDQHTSGSDARDGPAVYPGSLAGTSYG
jgi:hypothetical protein